MEYIYTLKVNLFIILNLSFPIWSGLGKLLLEIHGILYRKQFLRFKFTCTCRWNTIILVQFAPEPEIYHNHNHNAKSYKKSISVLSWDNHLKYVLLIYIDNICEDWYNHVNCDVHHIDNNVL